MTTRPFSQILSISDLKHTAKELGSFFFTPGAMSFFNSRVPNFIVTVDDSNGFFITSEQYGEDAPRHFQVREYFVTRTLRDSDQRIMDKLEIDTIGAKFDTLAKAKTEARKLADVKKYLATS